MRKGRRKASEHDNYGLDTNGKEAAYFAQQHTGLICDVTNVENELLFAGITGEYEPEEDTWRIDLRRGNETPFGIEYGMKVKIKMKIATEKEKAWALIYGSVASCEKSFWDIHPEKIGCQTENREAFLQTVSTSGMIRTESGESQPCRVIDISLTGLCFQSEKSYDILERLLLFDICLLPDGHFYSFQCQIVRCEQEEGKENRYGCRFLEISEKEQDILWRELLVLQTRHRR